MGCSHNKVLHLSVGVFYVFLNIEIHTFWNTHDKYKHTKSNWWDWSNVSTLSSNTLSPLLLCSDNQQHVISIASIIPTQNYFQLTHTQINKSLHKYTINKYTNHRRFPHYPHPESLSADDNALKNLIKETEGIFDGSDFSQIGLQKYWWWWLLIIIMIWSHYK